MRRWPWALAAIRGAGFPFEAHEPRCAPAVKSFSRAPVYFLQRITKEILRVVHI